MSVQLSLYDALVSIAVPTEKARAVVDAMEREMSSTLATKSDIQLIRQELGQLKQEMHIGLGQLKQELHIGLGQLKQELHMEVGLLGKEIELLRSSMTVRLGSMLAVACGILFAALKLI
jgi:hypothetical protein